MAGRTTETVSLAYGIAGRLDLEIDESRLRAAFTGPAAVTDPAAVAAAALASPIEFPPLEQAILPDDTVTLALDRDTVGSDVLIAAIWDRLAGRKVAPENVTVLEPAGSAGDPRAGLPAAIRDRVRHLVHDPRPEEEGVCRYLAATASGERVYLAPALQEADVAVSVGAIGFDPLLGVRGTHSVFYPGLSTAEAARKSHGQGHRELEPDDARPLRTLADEVGWLLGSPFTVQSLPAAGGGIAGVLAGTADPVLRRGRAWLTKHWTVRLAERAETVVVAVDGPDQGWEPVAAALSVARGLVARDGRIVVLSDLSGTPGQGMELLRRAESPADAFRPLRHAAPPDLLAATRWAEAADHARVYLLSRLDSDLAEDLFCVPIEHPAEAARLLSASDESCAFVGSAQHAAARIG